MAPVMASLKNLFESTTNNSILCHSINESNSSLMVIFLLFLVLFICFTVYFWFRLLVIDRKLVQQHNTDKLMNLDLAGKTVVITGANVGIGAQLALDLASKGARLVFACRDIDKARSVADSIIAANPTVYISLQHLDLSSMNSVRICANEILNSEPKIDILVNCASVAFVNEPTKSIDGHELHLATNYYGHYLFTQLLAERLIKTANEQQSISKVINVSSIIHRVGKIQLQDINLDKQYSPIRAYSQSKLAMILACREWARSWKSQSLHVYCVDPGLTWTSTHYSRLHTILCYLISILAIIFFQSVNSAAQNILHIMIDPNVTKQTGYYYEKCHAKMPACQATDEKMVKSLLEITMKCCDLSQSTNSSVQLEKS